MGGQEYLPLKAHQVSARYHHSLSQRQQRMASYFIHTALPLILQRWRSAVFSLTRPLRHVGEQLAYIKSLSVKGSSELNSTSFPALLPFPALNPLTCITYGSKYKPCHVLHLSQHVWPNSALICLYARASLGGKCYSISIDLNLLTIPIFKLSLRWGFGDQV